MGNHAEQPRQRAGPSNRPLKTPKIRYGKLPIERKLRKVVLGTNFISDQALAPVGNFVAVSRS